MTPNARNRLLTLGILWGLLLAAVPALVMTDPYRLTGFLIAGLALAALSGCVGTLAAGRRAAKGAGRSGFLAGVGTGTFQGLVGGGVAALLLWVLMAVTISGFTLRNPVELSVLMSPRVFTGSFFVALSGFVYAFLGGLLLGPVFGSLVNRTVRAGKDAGGDDGGKEDLVVR
jgi:hypothetical protein